MGYRWDGEVRHQHSDVVGQHGELLVTRDGSSAIESMMIMLAINGLPRRHFHSYIVPITVSRQENTYRVIYLDILGNYPD